MQGLGTPTEHILVICDGGLTTTFREAYDLPGQQIGGGLGQPTECVRPAATWIGSIFQQAP
jgi:hypothetical protein